MEWIKVEDEKKPNVGQYVIATDGLNVHETLWTGKEWFCFNPTRQSMGYDVIWNKVIAWCYLPPLPEV